MIGISPRYFPDANRRKNGDRKWYSSVAGGGNGLARWLVAEVLGGWLAHGSRLQILGRPGCFALPERTFEIAC